MDRFIVCDLILQKAHFVNLKSNMDRFIEILPNDIDCVFDYLKSNMDRFIEQM